MNLKLCCLVHPLIGCNACGWKMCEPCRRKISVGIVNRQIHKEFSNCIEGPLVGMGRPEDWPHFYLVKSDGSTVEGPEIQR